MGNTAYFNNAATSYPKPEVVYTFMDKYYREYGMNAGRSGNITGNRLISETRSLLLEMFHCPNKKVVLVPSATEAINIILQGLALSDNFNIYISPFEHNAVLRTINYLKLKNNLNTFTLPVDREALSFDLEKIKYQFSEAKPNLVVISHASNVCGVIAPIQDICTLSKQHDAINLIDMSQTAGLIDTDLSPGIYDFAVFAGHKTLYGPFGIAGFICNSNAKLDPLIYGGTGVDSANKDMPSTIPEKYEAGSQNILAIAGLNAALKWIKETGIQNIYQKEKSNYERLINLLSAYDNIQIIGQEAKEQTVAVTSCIFDGYSSDNIGAILSEHGVEVRTGLHCAPSAHEFLNTFPAGTVRFSASYFNTDNEFEILKEALDYIEENS
ncbi:aminotransferase class V-fold PLP-dependent enzyme [Paludicola sp. MB14-C6]|uniref:aminotransferase class V-fold PLP-dependent enzyme n=1 Tax=Paludihabitans sp. MB14-C6 TaxID=3070656 RepID=UPI0027DB4793|nr:aminotransferase class V-fold PLP-dependent enzyme [Paludicola sp. MB14-C6]WMJ22913.1 aminotransferase class V-fold PLP-dependent enzyme [Paludicola sp. MB14-C6]